MNDQEAKKFSRRDGKAELRIYRRADGLFSFEEWKLVPHYDPGLAEALRDFSEVWMPVDRPLSLCDSLETAEREARSSVSWLAE